ncbi:MAG TPA: hypothetical protein PKW79_06355 [Rhabdochlamydiaceae bacterium]|nr:hypothetical protein [Rhabdochlamydiaceae bacterium]
MIADALLPRVANPTKILTLLKPAAIQKATEAVGWKVGDSIRNLTKKGNVPSWSAVRARHWKNKALWAKHNPNDYGAANIARMEKALAPQK